MPKPAPHDHPIHPILRDRWIPLSFDPNRPVAPEILLSLWEAARWSPSAFNEQPWRFIVGTRDYTPETYQKIFDCLLPGNQTWAGAAPVLMLSLAKKTFSHNGQPNRFALFDTGQAVGSLLFQAGEGGLSVHQMAGYDTEKAREVFALPDDFEPVAVLAVGYEGDPSLLTDEKLRARHTTPTRSRKPLNEIVWGGAGSENGFDAPSPLLPTPTEEKK